MNVHTFNRALSGGSPVFLFPARPGSVFHKSTSLMNTVYKEIV